MVRFDADTAGPNEPQMGDIAAWNVFIHWKAFDHIPLEGSISYRDLAGMLAADEGLVGLPPLHPARIIVSLGGC